MRQFIKDSGMYIAVLVFAAFILILVSNINKQNKQESKTILQIIRHYDNTYTLILEDRAFDALTQSELDSIIETLK